MREKVITIPSEAVLSVENFLESLSGKLFSIPFDNGDDDPIYAVTVELDGPGIIAETSDGSTFTIEVKKI